MRCFAIFKIKVCSPPTLDPANPLYYRRVLSVYTIYLNGKLGQGRWNEGGGAEEDEWSDSSMEKIYSNDL